MGLNPNEFYPETLDNSAFIRKINQVSIKQWKNLAYVLNPAENYSPGKSAASSSKSQITLDNMKILHPQVLSLLKLKDVRVNSLTLKGDNVASLSNALDRFQPSSQAHSPSQARAEIPKDKIFNPSTGRFINSMGKTAKRLLATNKNNK
jgi:hypothetical protein